MTISSSSFCLSLASIPDRRTVFSSTGAKQFYLEGSTSYISQKWVLEKEKERERELSREIQSSPPFSI